MAADDYSGDKRQAALSTANPSRSLRPFAAIAAITTAVILPNIWPILTKFVDGIIALPARREESVDKFYTTFADLLIKNNRHSLDGAAGSPASYIARAVTLNTFTGFDPVFKIPFPRWHAGGLITHDPHANPLSSEQWSLFEDKDKKLQLVKFLYESKLIGYCKNFSPDSSLSQVGSYPSRLEVIPAKFSLRGASLRGLDFSSLDNLCGIDLDGVDLRESSFASVFLGGARLKNADLKWANFTETYLYNANMERADLRYAIFKDSEIVDSNLKAAYLCDTDLSIMKLFKPKPKPELPFYNSNTQFPTGASLGKRSYGDCYDSLRRTS
jgi:hypothetical protein